MPTGCGFLHDFNGKFTRQHLRCLHDKNDQTSSTARGIILKERAFQPTANKSSAAGALKIFPPELAVPKGGDQLQKAAKMKDENRSQ